MVLMMKIICGRKIVDKTFLLEIECWHRVIKSNVFVTFYYNTTVIF